MKRSTCVLDHCFVEVLPDLLTELLYQPVLSRALLEVRGDARQHGVKTLLLYGHHLSALHTLSQEHEIILQVQVQ